MDELIERFEEAKEFLGPKKSREYVENIAKILGVKKGIKGKRYAKAVDIVLEEFADSAGHTITNVFRVIGVLDELTYHDVLVDAAEQTESGGKNRHKKTVQKLEEGITRDYLDNLWDSLDHKDKERVRSAILEQMKIDRMDNTALYRKVATSATPLAAIMAGQAAGFSLYLAAVSGLHAVASVLGISLGFGVYTTLTSGLSVVLGPLGIVAASVFATYQFGQPSYERKILPCILLFTALRGEIEMCTE
jgi:uncharacterized protein YaaW (UPF0174 family)